VRHLGRVCAQRLLNHPVHWMASFNIAAILRCIVSSVFKQVQFLFGVGVAQSLYSLTTGLTTGVRSPTEDFSSSLCVQTGSGAHPASCTMGTGDTFPGVKRGRGVPSSSAEVENE
jgi:hypothetical protein